MTSINFHAVDANGPFIPFHRLSAKRFCNDSLTPFCKVHVDRVTPGAGDQFPDSGDSSHAGGAGGTMIFCPLSAKKS